MLFYLRYPLELNIGSMKQSIYDQIVTTVADSAKLRKSDCMLKLHELFPDIQTDTLMSIYSQYHQRRIKTNFHLHHRKDNINKYFRQYCCSAQSREPPGFLFRLAYEVDIPPTSLAKIIIEEYFKNFHETEFSVVRTQANKCIKDTSLISNDILRKEVELCILNDDHCGPSVEKIKQEIGLKYEQVLHDLLTAKDIPYYDESVLRKQGYDKTPDFKLVSPIAVDNYVVNWIESKASFGDEESHNGYLKGQFWSYTNRFGPGLVIYWFGFIDELNINMERGVLLGDQFPDNYVTLEELLDRDIQNMNWKGTNVF